MDVQIARQLLAEGALTVLRLPRLDTEFVSPTGQVMAWRYLETHFPPVSWWAWADLALHTRPFVMPRLADFLAGHDFYQRAADPGQVCIVIDDGTTSFTRIVVPSGETGVPHLGTVVATLLGIDVQMEFKPALPAEAPIFVPNRSTGWSPYFDRGGRHVAEKSG